MSVVLRGKELTGAESWLPESRKAVSTYNLETRLDIMERTDDRVDCSVEFRGHLGVERLQVCGDFPVETLHNERQRTYS